jgi:CheY-like chemotaxis protein
VLSSSQKWPPNSPRAPIKPNYEKGAKLQPVAVKQPSLQNIKIVVVDDHPDIRLLIARFLSDQGAQVFTAKNAFEGLRLVREIQPHVVLSDLRMPDRNGFELLVDIQDFSRSMGRTIPVIAITAHRHKQEQTAAAGFQMHLEKPFTPDQLLATINLALHR